MLNDLRVGLLRLIKFTKLKKMQLQQQQHDCLDILIALYFYTTMIGRMKVNNFTLKLTVKICSYFVTDAQQNSNIVH